MPIGGVLLIIHWLLVVRDYLKHADLRLRRAFRRQRECFAMSASAILLLSACAYLAIGIPVAFALGLSTLTAVVIGTDFPLFVLLKETFTGIDSFPLMAVPFFILAAELMSGGSLTEVLLRFASQFVGHKRGGLGYTNVVGLTFFSGISGSALADAAGPGSMMIRMMDKAGYDRAYAAALTAATAIVGPIIPPSIIMIIYALQDESVSVGALFMAGLLPGLLIAVGMSVVNWRISTKRNYRGDDEQPGWREIVKNSFKALPALLLPVLILGGMRAGWFTPTEAIGRRGVLRADLRQVHVPHARVEGDCPTSWRARRC